MERADMVAFSSPGTASAGATGGKTDVRNEIYRESGVDTAEADAGLNRIIARVQRTWPAAGLGRVVLPIGYFANVIELDGVGLALCTDGVGVIGVKTSGIHSNGLSLARKAFFVNHGYAIDHKFDELAVTLGEELLRPTDIYVPEAMEILAKVSGVKALINITSDGLLNL